MDFTALTIWCLNILDSQTLWEELDELDPAIACDVLDNLGYDVLDSLESSPYEAPDLEDLLAELTPSRLHAILN